MNQDTNKSETITEIAKALGEFQSKCPTLNKGSKGYGYNYADLPSIVQSITPILKECNLSFTQLSGGNADNVTVTTILVHTKSGEFFQTCIASNVKANKGNMSEIQAVGSIITYLRRYSLSSILGIVTDEDVDGHVQKPSINTLLQEVSLCTTKDQLKSVWDSYNDMQQVPEFANAVKEKNQSFGNPNK